MASSSTHVEHDEQTQEQHCRSGPQDSTLSIRSYSDYFHSFSTLSFWVSRSFRKLHFTSRISEGSCLTAQPHSGMLESSYAVAASSSSCSPFLEEDMCPTVLSSSDPGMPRRESNSSFEESPPTSPSFWRSNGIEPQDFTSSNGGECAKKQGSAVSEMEMMKERLSKLLLGEDMSGCGNGVSTALAISNAITNLCATLFGQLWRLERTPLEKKAMWRREMEWFLSVTDHIVEMEPSSQIFSDRSKLQASQFSLNQVMACRPRSDICINLPALRKLDNMLLEILDSFEDTEFWYVDQGILAPDEDGSSSSHSRDSQHRQEEKWWLPIPRVPPEGLSEDFRRNLQNKRDRTNQIFKAAMAINSMALADMEVPEAYFSAIPKNARTSLGDIMYRYIISDQFFPEHLLDYLNLSSEHQATEIADRVEAAVYIWGKGASTRTMNKTHTRSSSKSSWDLMKELVIDSDKRELLADRAQVLLHCLKQRFPGLPQTTLDMYKLQFNKVSPLIAFLLRVKPFGG
ncbi:hypothetical protein SAY87_023903 [Trapa incisa]|uniref:PRONE domain-containing protein n=1 Tax=Trapa incisa TaxID=236973 RepID=A0AAN7L7L1_9MYRT|nr:hypothetical protein SAY87_023903 [Trapa incisa]